jgi:hypothetical protein
VHLFISMERWMVLCYIKRNIGVLKIVSGLWLRSYMVQRPKSAQKLIHCT